MNDAPNSYSFGQTQSLLNGESGKMSELFRKIQEYVESTPEKIVFSSLGDGRNVTWRELDMVSGKVYRWWFFTDEKKNL